MFEETVDGLSGSVRCAGVVEEREDVIAAPFQRLPQRPQLVETGRDAAVELGDQPGHDPLPYGRLVSLVGVDHVLVDAPSGRGRDIPLVGEHLREPMLLLGGQQPSSGPGDASDPVERITGASPMPQRLLLDALPAAVELVPDQGHQSPRCGPDQER